MANEGQVRNPTGANGFTGPGGVETPYGAIKRLGQMTKAAPLGTIPGANAAQQATRVAQRPSPSGGGPVAPQLPTTFEAPPAPYSVQVADAWAEVAATPGASPLVQKLAMQAAAEAERNRS